MRKIRFSMIIFILLVISFVSVSVMANVKLDEVENETGSELVDLYSTGHPEEKYLNASITNIVRNITVKITSQLILEDSLTLKIHDNVTNISLFNYTIPTVFDQFIEKIDFYSTFDPKKVLKTSENRRSYSVYSGIEATTYSFNIEENGTAANNTLDGIFIYARFEAIDAIKYGSYFDDQFGTFTSPVRPVFPNLPVENSQIGIKLESTLDQFLSDNITRIMYEGGEFPIFVNERKNLEWYNITRDPFDSLIGLEENYDYTEITFNSRTEAEGTVIVPYIFKEAIRHVRLDPWGDIFVIETITVAHVGAPLVPNQEKISQAHAIGGVNLLVYGGALITDIYDEQGSLNTALRLDDTFYPRTNLDTDNFKQILAVNFRTPIYGGETYKFSFEYRIKSSDVISVNDNQYTFNTTIFSGFNTTITKLDVIYELPAGATLNSQTFQSYSRKSVVDISVNNNRRTLSFFRHVELHYSIINASFIDNNQFQIKYTYRGLGPIGLGHIQFIITFILIMTIFLTFLLVSREFKFSSVTPAEIAKEQIPIEKIDSFFGLFTERSGASKRIADLRARRKKGKINKKDYDGQIKAIQRRIRAINPQLDVAAKNLSNEGTKYSLLVSKVMIASQRQKDIRTNSTRARKEYQKGETPKDIFQKLMRDYSRNLEKQESIINRGLSEMHELIQQYS